MSYSKKAVNKLAVVTLHSKPQQLPSHKSKGNFNPVKFSFEIKDNNEIKLQTHPHLTRQIKMERVGGMGGERLSLHF